MDPEERLIIELTGEVGRENPPSAAGADWRRVLRLARANRLVGAVFDGIDRAGLLFQLPEAVRKGFEGDYLRQVAGIRSALDLAAGFAESSSASGRSPSSARSGFSISPVISFPAADGWRNGTGSGVSPSSRRPSFTPPAAWSAWPGTCWITCTSAFVPSKMFVAYC